MSIESITTGLGIQDNDFVVEFLTETIPYYATKPAWGDIFRELGDLSEEERAGMLQRLDPVNGSQLLGLENDEQFSTALAFIRLSLEEPLNPRMLGKMIDYENHRVQKIS